MDDKDWLMLKTIHETTSLSKAANLLYISQPALSYRLRNLEREFGTKILDRHATGVSFTMHGEYLLQYAEEMLNKFQKTKTFIQSTTIPVHGVLRIGISTVFAKFKIAPILKEFRNRFPSVTISLKTGSSTMLLPDLLRKDHIDIAIVRGDIDWPEQKHVLMEEPWCLIYSCPIELDQLPDIPWILDETAILIKTDIQFHTWWHDHLTAIPPSHIMVDSIEACIQLVSYGIGWAIVPKIYLGKNHSLFCLPLFFSNGKPLLRKTNMIYKNQALTHSPSKAFVDFIMSRTQYSGI